MWPFKRKSKRSPVADQTVAIRHLGDGYEPHVEEAFGKLTYSLPVDSGHVSTEFSFEIRAHDLDVLKADPYRRAVLEVVAHTVLQPSMMRGAARITQHDFDGLVSSILHSAPAALEELIERISRDHHIVIRRYVDDAMTRRSLT